MDIAKAKDVREMTNLAINDKKEAERREVSVLIKKLMEKIVAAATDRDDPKYFIVVQSSEFKHAMREILENAGYSIASHSDGGVEIDWSRDNTFRDSDRCNCIENDCQCENRFAPMF